MKTATRLLTLLLPLTAAATEVPGTPQGWAQRMLDPTQNALAFKDPQVFTHWLGAMSNPATALALASQGMDPNTYARILAAMANPAMLHNYLQFSDPSIAMRWLAAGVDPNFYAALMAQGLNPANYPAWMTLPLNPQAWNLGLQMLNPALYANWMTAPLNPNLQGAMLAPLNPATYGQWMGTTGMASGVSTAPATPATTSPPATQAPAQAPVFNPLDPTSLLNFINPAAAGKK